MKKLVIIILITLTFLLAGCSSVKYTTESLDKLATCLADNNVKEYGAFWCPNCAEQKKLFGSSYTIIMDKGVYVECDPRGENSKAELCLEKEIQKYPTWDFPDGSRVVGVIELEELANKANCPVPILK